MYSYSKDGNWTVYDNEMLLDNGVRWVIIITDDENEDEEDIHNQENHSTWKFEIYFFLIIFLLYE